MLMIKIELWPYGRQDQAQELGRLWVANTGGTRTKGEYKTAVMRKGEIRCPWEHGRGGNETAEPVREGVVLDHPRLSEPVWSLVRKALEGMGY